MWTHIRNSVAPICLAISMVSICAIPVLAADVPDPDETITLDPLTGMGDDTTESKPQSKTWKHDDTWWAALSDGDGTWLWKLDGTTWDPVFAIDTANDLHADCKRVGNLVHILMQDNGTLRLATLEYSNGTYQPWSVNPDVAPLDLASSVETATIDVDTTGRLWVAYDTTTNVEVRFSDSPYDCFSAATVLESTITSDDISVITTLNDGSIGVFWSNQNDERFGFRRHIDGDSPTTWSSDEVPASQSALNIGDGMADDHMNLAIGTDGTLYAAVKTSYDQAGETKIALLVRRPSGTWDDLYQVDTDGTRPNILLDEDANRLRVTYIRNEGSNPIVTQTASTADLAFCGQETLINVVLIDPTSTKEVVDGDEVILASRNGTVRGVRLSSDVIDPPPTPVGLAGHWAFEEGSGTVLVDASGQANTGTLSGAADWTTGVVGQALDLEGGYGIVSDDSTLDFAGALTLSAWVQPSEIREQAIIKKATTTVDGYELSLDGNGHAYVQINAVSSGTSFRLETSEVYATSGAWVHLAATYGGTGLRIYIDGVLSASRTSGPLIGTNNVSLTLGGSGDGSDRFSGAMDEARVYDRSLTPAEISVLANGDPPPPPETELVGHWRLDEGEGSIIMDASPFDNDGSISGTPVWVEGVDNLALDVDGHCTVPNAASLNITTNITMAAWLRPDDITTQYVMKKALAEAVDGYELSLSSGGYPFVRFNQASVGNDYRINAVSDYPSNGVDWMHLAATYDGSVMRLYVNGIEEGTLEATFVIGTNNLALGLGSQEDGILPFLGAMDDLYLFDEVLTPTEIMDLMNVPASVPETGTEAGTFDDTEGGPRIVLAGANPFRDQVTLRVDFGAEVDRTLLLDAPPSVSIFDARGRHIQQLELGTDLRTSWDGTDRFGRPLPNGVYWAGLEYEGTVGRRTGQRLVLLR